MFAFQIPLASDQKIRQARAPTSKKSKLSGVIMAEQRRLKHGVWTNNKKSICAAALRRATYPYKSGRTRVLPTQLSNLLSVASVTTEAANIIREPSNSNRTHKIYILVISNALDEFDLSLPSLGYV